MVIDKYRIKAIELAKKLKNSDFNNIDSIAKAIFPFNRDHYPNDNLKSESAQLFYDWIMTLCNNQNLSESEKEKLFNQFINALQTEFAVSSLLSKDQTEIAKSMTQTPQKNSKSIFVLMPFKNQSSQSIYNDVLKPVVESFGYSISKADENLKIGVIIEQIKDSIKNSILVIADVSGKNPNVFYELGYAHGIGKKTLIITSNEEDIPFDISHIRYFHYSIENSTLDELKHKFELILKNNLEEISYG